MVGSPFSGLFEGKSQDACEQAVLGSQSRSPKAWPGSGDSTFLVLSRKQLLVSPASCTTVGPLWRSLLCLLSRSTQGHWNHSQMTAVDRSCVPCTRGRQHLYLIVLCHHNCQRHHTNEGHIPAGGASLLGDLWPGWAPTRTPLRWPQRWRSL